MLSTFGGILALINGTPGATRTPDKRFRKPLLYPPELQGLEAKFQFINTVMLAIGVNLALIF